MKKQNCACFNSLPWKTTKGSEVVEVGDRVKMKVMMKNIVISILVPIDFPSKDYFASESISDITMYNINI